MKFYLLILFVIIISSSTLEVEKESSALESTAISLRSETNATMETKYDWDYVDDKGKTKEVECIECMVNDRMFCINKKGKDYSCKVMYMWDTGIGKDEKGYCIKNESSENLLKHYYNTNKQKGWLKSIQYYMTDKLDVEKIDGLKYRHQIWTKRCLTTKNCYSFGPIDVSKTKYPNLHCGNFFKNPAHRYGFKAYVGSKFGKDTTEKFCAPDFKSDERGFKLGDYCDDDNLCFNGMTCRNHYCLLECTDVPFVCDRFGHDVKCQRYSAGMLDDDKLFCLDEKYVLNTHNAPYLTECTDSCTNDFTCLPHKIKGKEKSYCTYPCQKDEDCNLYRSFVDMENIECKIYYDSKGLNKKYCQLKSFDYTPKPSAERNSLMTVFNQLKKREEPEELPEYNPVTDPKQFFIDGFYKFGLGRFFSNFLGGLIDGIFLSAADKDFVVGIINIYRAFTKAPNKMDHFRKCVAGHSKKVTAAKKDEEDDGNDDSDLKTKFEKFLKSIRSSETNLIIEGKEKLREKIEKLKGKGREKNIHESASKLISEEDTKTGDESADEAEREYNNLKCTDLDKQEMKGLKEIEMEIKSESDKLNAIQAEYELTYRGDLLSEIKQQLGSSFASSRIKKFSKMKKKLEDRLTYLKYVKSCAKWYEIEGKKLQMIVNSAIKLWHKLTKLFKNFITYLITKYMPQLNCVCEIFEGLGIDFCDKTTENFEFIVTNIYYNIIEFKTTDAAWDYFGNVKDSIMELKNFLVFLFKGPVNKETFGLNLGHFIGIIARAIFKQFVKSFQLADIIKDMTKDKGYLQAIAFML